ncbi:MAG: hypothetical protein M3Z05_00655 [Gemmatimonadota bacterium]|nr:hypothetical protein [Gemmatimonadota bacterium]
MRHTVKLKDVIVGHSDLENADPNDGRAWGTFRPGFGYDLVQPVFRLFTKAVPMLGGEPFDEITLEKYYAARDRLGLSLVDAQGAVIRTSAIHIADYLEEKGIIEVEALISDAGYWENRVS